VATRPPVRRRGFFEVRWRQFRNAPRPVVRAVLSPLIVAIGLGLLYLAYDVALTRGLEPPGGDLRLLAVAIFVGLVLAVGTIVTYLIVPQPGRSGERQTRSGWSAALGFFAAVPIAYLILVVEGQVLLPLLT
jgi:multisubunit Na+/H+ antiporter MnhB subunit